MLFIVTSTFYYCVLSAEKEAVART